MKICPKCNAGNKNHEIRCKECYMSLLNTNANKTDFFKESKKLKVKKEKLERLINPIVLITFVVLYIIVFVLTKKDVGDVYSILWPTIFYILPIICYTLSYVILFYPKKLFYFSTSFDYIPTKSIGYSFLFVGLCVWCIISIYNF